MGDSDKIIAVLFLRSYDVLIATEEHMRSMPPLDIFNTKWKLIYQQNSREISFKRMDFTLTFHVNDFYIQVWEEPNIVWLKAIL